MAQQSTTLNSYGESIAQIKIDVTTGDNKAYVEIVTLRKQLRRTNIIFTITVSAFVVWNVYLLGRIQAYK